MLIEEITNEDYVSGLKISGLDLTDGDLEAIVLEEVKGR